MYARYTEFLRDLMKNKETAEALNRALSTYPLYQPDKKYDLIPTREELNKKILNHYKYREIGFETVGRFLDELEIVMNEIMPLYNERLKSIAIMAEIEDPFATVDMFEEFTETSEGQTTNETSGTNKDTSKRTGSSSSEGSEIASSESSEESSVSSESTQNSNNKTVHSETPQDSLGITSKNIDNITYADDVQWNKGETTDSSSSSSTSSSEASTSSTNSNTSSNIENVENNGENSSNSLGTSKHTVTHTATRKGSQGVTTFGHDMIEYRTSFIDVMNEIINDERLNELFMNIF
jgi:hypothetical protein